MEGNFLEWDYSIVNTYGTTVATVSKELLNWTDTYVLDVANPNDALYVLMFVLAIDAENVRVTKRKYNTEMRAKLLDISLLFAIIAKV